MEVTTEQVEDIPVLIAEMERMEIENLADKHFLPHENWKRCSVGQIAVVWLVYILSEGDHRLNQVQDCQDFCAVSSERGSA